MRPLTLLLPLATTLTLSHAATRSTSTTTTTSATPTPSFAFKIANFSAAAPYHMDMQYQADVVWNPNPNYSARCLAHNSTYAQCPNAPGIVPFPSIECLGPGGTLPDNGRWHWQLNRAVMPATAAGGSAQEGFNFAISLGPVTDNKGVDHYYYGCQFFGVEKVKCDNTTRSQTGKPPAAYLDAPSVFDIPAQTTKGCKYDAVATGTVASSVTTAKTTAKAATTTKKA